MQFFLRNSCFSLLFLPQTNSLTNLTNIEESIDYYHAGENLNHIYDPLGPTSSSVSIHNLNTLRNNNSQNSLRRSSNSFNIPNASNDDFQEFFDQNQESDPTSNTENSLNSYKCIFIFHKPLLHNTILFKLKYICVCARDRTQ